MGRAAQTGRHGKHQRDERQKYQGRRPEPYRDRLPLCFLHKIPSFRQASACLKLSDKPAAWGKERARGEP